MDELEWTKATKSSTGNCVEVAWQTAAACSAGGCVEVAWQTAAKSAGGNCVEVAPGEDGSWLLRDSKDPDGPVLRFTPAEMAAFADGVKKDEFGF